MCTKHGPSFDKVIFDRPGLRGSNLSSCTSLDAKFVI